MRSGYSVKDAPPSCIQCHNEGSLRRMHCLGGSLTSAGRIACFGVRQRYNWAIVLFLSNDLSAGPTTSSSPSDSNLFSRRKRVVEYEAFGLDGEQSTLSIHVFGYEPVSRARLSFWLSLKQGFCDSFPLLIISNWFRVFQEEED